MSTASPSRPSTLGRPMTDEPAALDDRHRHRLDRLPSLLRERILVLDGAMGTMIQGHPSMRPASAASGSATTRMTCRAPTTCWSLTQPDVIRAIHAGYLDAGADIISTNTFNATRVSLADYGLEAWVEEINAAAARLARAAADEAEARDPERPRYVAGSLGPTTKTASLSPDVDDPGARNVTFDELVFAYHEAARGLVGGRRRHPA